MAFLDISDQYNWFSLIFFKRQLAMGHFYMTWPNRFVEWTQSEATVRPVSEEVSLHSRLSR